MARKRSQLRRRFLYYLGHPGLWKNSRLVNKNRQGFAVYNLPPLRVENPDEPEAVTIDDSENSMTVYPNPATDVVNVRAGKNFGADTKIVLKSADGTDWSVYQKSRKA